MFDVNGVNKSILFGTIVALVEDPLTRDKGMELVGQLADIVLAKGPYHDPVTGKTLTTREEFINTLVELMKLDPTMKEVS